MNPNSRNSEISNPTRRSFSGSPFLKPSIISGQRIGFNPSTPVNSPSDYPRRHSFRRENMVVSSHEQQEDQENGKDLNSKQDKLRSPASSKDAKNFMSPTISAASKINASPRKRILVERNEPARTSGSFSAGKSPLVADLDSKPRNGLKQKEVSFDSTVTYLGDDGGHEDLDSNVLSGTEDNFDSKTNDEDSVNLAPSFKISPRSPFSWTSPALAPLDADPSLPPYDPKTNYLSPRPQFLHYRPNPRVELYINKEQDGQKLEECFASEMFTDSEFTEEDTESEDASSIDTPKEEEKERVEEDEDEEQELLVSEPDPISDFEGDVAKDKRVSRPRFFTRKKVNALLFLLAAACFWHLVTKSPVMEPSVLNNLSFSEVYLPPEISEFSRQYFEVASQKIQLWLHRSFSYTWNLMISFSEQHKLGPLQYANLSLLENSLVDDCIVFDRSFQKAELEYEKNVLGEAHNNLLVGEGEPTETDESVVQGDISDQGFGKQENTEALDEKFEYSEDQKVSESEIIMNPTVEIREPGGGSLGAEVMQETSPVGIVQLQSNVDLEEEDQRGVQTAPAAEIQSEVYDSKELEGISDMSCSILAESVLDPAVKRPPRFVSMGSIFDELQDTFAAQKMLGISVFVLCVLATLALIRMKSQKPTAPNSVLTKKLSFTGEHSAPERRLSRNCQTEIDMVDEGSCCPSEMSSFQNSLSSKKAQLQRPTEDRSQERKPRKSYRRESLASSDSSSYGSFTTYEKFTGQRVNGEEEVITPVRRSSRIRNQVTSP